MTVLVMTVVIGSGARDGGHDSGDNDDGSDKW
jgi:hypothetical protein